GRAVEAKTVDHIKPKAHGGTDDDSNLQSLCWPCHKRKTARE
ncbi:HNH endonuclease, partial [Providencia sp. PROV273]